MRTWTHDARQRKSAVSKGKARDGRCSGRFGRWNGRWPCDGCRRRRCVNPTTAAISLKAVTGQSRRRRIPAIASRRSRREAGASCSSSTCGPVAERGAKTVRDRSDIVLAEQLAEGGIAHRLSLDAGKQQAAAVDDLSRLGECSRCRRTQRYAVLEPRLHASARNDPKALVDIDFRPGGAAHLAAARGRQDEEAEHQRGTGPGVGVVDDGERLGYVLVWERDLTSGSLRVSPAIGEGGAGGIEGMVCAVSLCNASLNMADSRCLSLRAVSRFACQSSRSTAMQSAFLTASTRRLMICAGCLFNPLRHARVVRDASRQIGASLAMTASMVSATVGTVRRRFSLGSSPARATEPRTSNWWRSSCSREATKWKCS